MKKRARTTYRYDQFVQLKKAYVCNLGRRRRWPQAMKKRNNSGKKLRENIIRGDCCSSVDRISELPHEIIVSILSLVSLKEAAATSILSRRWRYVWTSTMTLVFDSNEFDANPNRFDNQDSRAYVDWVNRVVEQHAGTTIRRFRACLDLDSRFTSSVDDWIRIAMSKRVEILELDFCAFTPGFPKNYYMNYYKFGKAILGLEIPILGASCGRFEALKVLHVYKVSVTGEFLEYLLCHCPVLERLTVGYASSDLVYLKVVGPAIALKHLAIHSCYYLESIEIRDVNLVSFHYNGKWTINLALGKTPSLVEISVSHSCIVYDVIPEHPFTQLSSCLSQLEILELDTDGVDDYFQTQAAFPIFTNLKHLKLLVNVQYSKSLGHLTCFINACPYLQRLVLKVKETFPCPWGEVELERASKCPHNYVKILEILGYHPHPCIDQHVKFLIENLVGLEKIIVDPVVRHWCWDIRLTRDGGEPNKEAEARDHAMQHLKQKVPSTVEFVCN